MAAFNHCNTLFNDPSFIQEENPDQLSNLSKKKYHQKKSILFHLYQKGHLSNPEICKLTNMSSPSIHKLLKELISDNLVREEGIGQSIGGRRPNMYGIIPNSRFIVGINIGLSGSEIAVFNLNNKLIQQIQFLKIPLENTPGFIDQIFEFTIKLLGKYKISQQQLLGIGIAIPGLTDPISGSSLSYLNYSGKSIKELFEEKFAKPVFVDNDARVMAHAEHVFGFAHNKINVLCLNIGAGIGMGMILNKKLYHGKSGFSGEFGHIKVEENGDLCICGKHGCLETVASGEALVRNTLAAIQAGKPTKILAMINGSTITCSTVVEAARMGDQLAIDMLGTIGEYLGKGLATLIHIFNPEAIILGGELAPANQFIIDPIKQTLNKHTIYQINKDTTITTSTLGKKAALMGALALVMDNIFEDVESTAIV